MSDAVFKRVCETVSIQFGLINFELKPDTRFVEDLGADSLDTVELVMAFEEVFGIEIPFDVEEKMLTVGDAATLIKGLLG